MLKLLLGLFTTDSPFFATGILSARISGCFRQVNENIGKLELEISIFLTATLFREQALKISVTKALLTSMGGHLPEKDDLQVFQAFKRKGIINAA